MKTKIETEQERKRKAKEEEILKENPGKKGVWLYGIPGDNLKEDPDDWIDLFLFRSR